MWVCVCMSRERKEVRGGEKILVSVDCLRPEWRSLHNPSPQCESAGWRKSWTSFTEGFISPLAATQQVNAVLNLENNKNWPKEAVIWVWQENGPNKKSSAWAWQQVMLTCTLKKKAIKMTPLSLRQLHTQFCTKCFEKKGAITLMPSTNSIQLAN